MRFVHLKQMNRGTPYLIDIAVNITDPLFRGFDLKGRRTYEDDFERMLHRAEEAGVKRMIITGSSLAQCERAIHLCRQYNDRKLYCTIGVHPAHCSEFFLPLKQNEVDTVASNYDLAIHPIEYKEVENTPSAKQEENMIARLSRLKELILENRDVVVAVGEIGIDYAELRYCPKHYQEHFFLAQLRFFKDLGLPFLFHSRDCGLRFVEILETEKKTWQEKTASDPNLRGVVHSFNGPLEEQERLMAMPNMFISVNGSAFREEELARQICRIPLDRIMLETDAPWCDIRQQHYGSKYVVTRFDTANKKSLRLNGRCLERRNEPCHLVQVLEAYAGCLSAFKVDLSDKREISKNDITKCIFDNVFSLFSLQ